MTRMFRSAAFVLSLALLVPPNSAIAQKPGGQSARQVGDGVADLLSDNLTELIIVLVGVCAIAAFATRSIGQAAMVVVVGLISGMFIIEPNAALNLFKGIYDAIL